MNGLRRLTGLVAIVALGIVVPGGTVSAGPPDVATGTITLKGNGTSYIDVVLTEKVTPQADDIEVSTTGSYAGFVITQRLGDLVSLAGGSFVVTSFEKKATKAAGRGIGAVGFAQRKLEPGTYRFQLISDGRATVKIPVAGPLRSMTLKTTREARAQSVLESMGSGPGDLDHRWPVHRSRSTITLLGLLEIVDTHQASTGQQCLKEGSENLDACDQTEDYGGTWATTSPGSVGRGWIYSFAGFYTGYAVGERTAVQHVTQATAASENYAFYLNLPLTAPGANNMGAPAPRETFSFPYQFAGVQDQPVCAVYVATFIGSCGFVPARPSDREATVKIVDASGGPTAATVVVGDQRLEICGETTEPLDVDPDGGVYVDVHAHPTLDCPDAHGSVGSVEVTLSP
jgi:hypothetical protein